MELYEPVSYTHLDVYKRQEYARIRKLALAGEYQPVTYERKAGE